MESTSPVQTLARIFFYGMRKAAVESGNTFPVRRTKKDQTLVTPIMAGGLQRLTFNADCSSGGILLLTVVKRLQRFPHFRQSILCAFYTDFLCI